MSKKIAIEVHDLTKKYKLYSRPIDRLKESLNFFGKKYHTDFSAVKNVSFELGKGETVGIIGRNGCGKSTLLKMITNVLTPSSGQVIVHGHISAILELGAGFNPEMTGLENIYLNTAINGFSKKQTDNIVEDIVKFAELGEFVHQPTKMYSSGMSARLAFAVAINVKPDILIVDEALSVGDAAFQRKCFAKMEEIRANGATILFVSHSEASIVNLCSRAIWMSKGEKILDGDPKLVTGLYLKYSNETIINKDKVCSEYHQLANNDIAKDNLSREKKQSENTQEQQKLDTQKNEEDKTLTISSGSLKEYFDPKLKPSSTIKYESDGAIIETPQILTSDGEVVNNLIRGKVYWYTYRVKFTKSANNVRFGMLIKTVSGVELGGGTSDKSASNGLKLINDGEYIRIEYKFTCSLNAGLYFTNAGVLGSISGELKYLHRITDALCFRVVEDTSGYSTGTIDFSCTPEIFFD
ncbi:ABC transporter ATP-binding protein [Vibrio scophthalmi]|uniref:ABC transporter ATP-binding protein n=1 Tax=Vibrio scophthalmi TaxID=45658 RepID=UPI003EB70EBB